MAAAEALDLAERVVVERGWEAAEASASVDRSTTAIRLSSLDSRAPCAQTD